MKESNLPCERVLRVSMRSTYDYKLLPTHPNGGSSPLSYEMRQSSMISTDSPTSSSYARGARRPKPPQKRRDTLRYMCRVTLRYSTTPQPLCLSLGERTNLVSKLRETVLEGPVSLFSFDGVLLKLNRGRTNKKEQSEDGKSDLVMVSSRNIQSQRPKTKNEHVSFWYIKRR